MDDLTQQVISSILEETTNQQCFDCSMPDPTFVSVSHAVFLCSMCALYHIQIIPYYSQVAPINGPLLSIHTRTLQAGGNQRLLEFFDRFGVLQEHKGIDRYKTYASLYYKAMLKSEVLGRECEFQEPSSEEGCQIFERPVVQQVEEKVDVNQLPFYKRWYRKLVNFGNEAFDQLQTINDNEVMQFMDGMVTDQLQNIGKELDANIYQHEYVQDFVTNGENTILSAQKSLQDVQDEFWANDRVSRLSQTVIERRQTLEQATSDVVVHPPPTYDEFFPLARRETA